MKNINSEEPNVHWNFLNVKDKIVLDLGCGKFYSSVSTAEYFLDQGAHEVIGIDLSDIRLPNYNFIMRVEKIDSTEQIKDLLMEWSPDVIKCDIEGAEKYLEGIDSLPYVEEIAIEYHDNNTKQICEKKIKDWNFNTELFQLLGEDISRIGVIYGKRKEETK
jgi:hypothetical protein